MVENIILIFLGERNNESLLCSKCCLVGRAMYSYKKQTIDTRKMLHRNLVSGQHEASSFFKSKNTAQRQVVCHASYVSRRQHILYLPHCPQSFFPSYVRGRIGFGSRQQSLPFIGMWAKEKFMRKTNDFLCTKKSNMVKHSAQIYSCKSKQ